MYRIFLYGHRKIKQYKYPVDIQHIFNKFETTVKQCLNKHSEWSSIQKFRRGRFGVKQFDVESVKREVYFGMWTHYSIFIVIQLQM